MAAQPENREKRHEEDGVVKWTVVAVTIAVLPGSYLLFAQAPAGQPAAAPPRQPMSFFVTSVGKGDGANLGGLAGADAHCQALAKTAGRGDARVARLPEHAGRRRRQRARPHRHRSVVQLPRPGHLGRQRGAARRHHRAGAHRQPARQAALAERERASWSTASATSRTSTTFSPVRPPTAAPTPTVPITPATTGRAIARGPRSWGTTTSRAAATDPGTRRIRARAAARTISSPPAGPGSSTASRSNRTRVPSVPRVPRVPGVGARVPGAGAVPVLVLCRACA